MRRTASFSALHDAFTRVLGDGRGRGDDLASSPTTTLARRRTDSLLLSLGEGPEAPPLRELRKVMRVLREHGHELDRPLLAELFEAVAARLSSLFSTRAHSVRLLDAMTLRSSALPAGVAFPPDLQATYERELAAELRLALRRQLEAPPQRPPEGLRVRAFINTDAPPSVVRVGLTVWHEVFCRTLATMLRNDCQHLERTLGVPLSSAMRRRAADPEFWKSHLPRSDIRDDAQLDGWAQRALAAVRGG